VNSPRAGMYIWTKAPEGYSSPEEFAEKLVLATGVVVSPGGGFGRYGKDFVRMALVEPKERLEEAVRRIDQWGGIR
jgi:aspartate/methionine/tyrosine aminotransferase